MVPIYHVPEYLLECIDSVLEQTYECFELIHVDYGSTDESGIIYDTEDSRLIVIHKLIAV
ncbi:MAG: glycosyltransferase [Candidatus Cryptobacteroides sp.]